MDIKKKILILGSRGFIAQNIYHKLNLVNINAELIFQDKEACNLYHVDSIQKSLLEHKPTIIINCAGIIGSSQSNKTKNQLDIFHSNIKININILDAIKDTPYVEQIIFFSSYRCFSANKNIIQEESMVDNFDLNHIIDDTNAGYLLSKIMLEFQIKLLSKNSNIIINNLYLPNIFGSFDYFNECSRIVPSLIYKISHLKTYKIPFLNNECESNINLNILYVDDLIKIIETIIIDNINCGNLIIYNSNNTFTLRELVYILKTKIYPDLDVLFACQETSSTLPHYNNDKFNHLFPNWIFTPVNESLDQTINYYLINYN